MGWGGDEEDWLWSRSRDRDRLCRCGSSGDLPTKKDVRGGQAELLRKLLDLARFFGERLSSLRRSHHGLRNGRPRRRILFGRSRPKPGHRQDGLRHPEILQCVTMAGELQQPEHLGHRRQAETGPRLSGCARLVADRRSRGGRQSLFGHAAQRPAVARRQQRGVREQVSLLRARASTSAAPVSGTIRRAISASATTPMER